MIKVHTDWQFIDRISNGEDMCLTEWANKQYGCIHNNTERPNTFWFTPYGEQPDYNKEPICLGFIGYYIARKNAPDKDKIRNDYYDIMMDKIRIAFTEYISTSSKDEDKAIQAYWDIEWQYTNQTYNNLFPYISKNEQKALLLAFLMYYGTFYPFDNTTCENDPKTRKKEYQGLRFENTTYEKYLQRAEKVRAESVKGKKNVPFISFDDDGTPKWNGTQAQLMYFAKSLYTTAHPESIGKKNYNQTLLRKIFNLPNADSKGTPECDEFIDRIFTRDAEWQKYKVVKPLR